MLHRGRTLPTPRRSRAARLAATVAVGALCAALATGCAPATTGDGAGAAPRADAGRAVPIADVRPAPRGRPAIASPAGRAPRLALRGAPGAPLRYALVGDSVAFSLMPTVAKAADLLGQRLGRTAVSVGMMVGPGFGLTADVPGDNDIGPAPDASAWEGWASRVAQVVVAGDPDLVVVLLGTWDTIVRQDGGRPLLPGTARWAAWYRERLTLLLDVLTARGASVAWVPMPCTNRPRVQAGLPFVRAEVERQALRRGGRVALVGLDDVVCPGGVPALERPDPTGRLRRFRDRDGVHFAPWEAAATLSPVLADRLAVLLEPVPRPPVREPRAR